MKGAVKWPNYKTGGVPKFKGPKNKRSYHAEQARRKEARRIERKAKMMESLELDPPSYQ